MAWTTNRHVFISRHTAHETGPVSDCWCFLRFQGLSVTLEQLRIDRQLEEAVAADADPLHIAAVFGVTEGTALRYAACARALLEGNLEHKQAPERPGPPPVVGAQPGVESPALPSPPIVK